MNLNTINVAKARAMIKDSVPANVVDSLMQGHDQQSLASSDQASENAAMHGGAKNPLEMDVRREIHRRIQALCASGKVFEDDAAYQDSEKDAEDARLIVQVSSVFTHHLLCIHFTQMCVGVRAGKGPCCSGGPAQGRALHCVQVHPSGTEALDGLYAGPHASAGFWERLCAHGRVCDHAPEWEGDSVQVWSCPHWGVVCFQLWLQHL